MSTWTRKILPFCWATLAFCSADPAAAKCRAQFVTTWPADGAKDQPRNTGIILTAGGSIARELASTNGFELVAKDGSRIALSVPTDLRSGDDFRSERTILLKPNRALAPNTHYHLAGPTARSLGVKLQFTTGQQRDTQPPSFHTAHAGPFTNRRLGCGPEHSIQISIPDATDPEGKNETLFVRLRLANAPERLQSGQILGEVVAPLLDGKMTFGHHMCYGNWPLEPGDHLFAAVSILDQALNESPARKNLQLLAR